MITREIEYLRPTSLEEALQLLSERGDEITILSGGMSLVPMMNLGLVRPAVVMSLNHLDELSGVTTTDSVLSIGATVRHRQVQGDPVVAAHAPMLAEAARAIGDVQVRNRGTIGGSVCHADPTADYLPVLAVSDAQLVLTRADSERTVPALDFFVDVMYTLREPNELLTAVVVPQQSASAGSAYVRFARIEGSFPIVNAAARIEPGFDRSGVALGGVGPTPVVVDATDLFAGGVSADGLEALAERVHAAAHQAAADVHADVEYRRHVAGVVARRAMEAAGSRLNGASR